MALTKIITDGITDDAVTEAKLANAINTAVAANTAKDLTALSASNLTSGTIPDARFPATLPAASAANLTAVPAANITGTLPAISGANLTGIASAGKAHNLVINGAMQVAQRGTSSTSSGYYTVDRFTIIHSAGVDESPTQAQVDVSSGTSPYTLGFRKALKVTNGNQTSGAVANTFIWIQTVIEAQDIANSGWNYTSSSSNITLSFWIKSSVAQDFKGYLRSRDGTNYEYPFATGALTADTWTKITKTISGNSNIQIDNDNEAGLEINILAFLGTDRTDGGTTENAWATFNSAARTKDNTSTWYTTDNATLEITGVQLEVGESATDFEHRSFAVEKRLCKRYYQEYKNLQMSGYVPDNNARVYGLGFNFPVEMRTPPTVTISNTGSSSGQAISTGDLNANITSLLSQGTSTYNAEMSVNVSQDLTDNRPAVASSAGYTVRETKYMFNGEL